MAAKVIVEDEVEEVRLMPVRFRLVFYGDWELEFTGMAPPVTANNPDKERELDFSGPKKLLQYKRLGHGRCNNEDSPKWMKRHTVFMTGLGQFDQPQQKKISTKNQRKDLQNSAFKCTIYRVILDNDNDIAGISSYPITDNGNSEHWWRDHPCYKQFPVC